MEPPRSGGALSTWGFLSFQLLGPPSFVDVRGIGLTGPCKVGGVGALEPQPRPGGGAVEDRGTEKSHHPRPCLGPKYPEWGLH